MNSATIVTAALDSSQLETSINALVKMVDEKAKAMAKSFTDEVARMEQAVKNLGKIKIDSGGAADSSISKQTKAQNDATQATDRRVQKEKELNMTLDQGGDILQKVARYASEVRLPDAAKSARESFQAFYKGFNEQARQIEPLIQSWEKLLQARHTGNIEQVAQKIAQVKHEIAELVKEQANLSKTKPQGYLDEIAKRNPQIKALRDQLISLETEHQKLKASDPFKDNPYLNTLREKLQGVKSAMNDADTTNRRWLQTTQQLTEAQKKSVDEQMKLFYTRTMKIPTDQYDMQIAKLERIQSLLQSYRRGEVSFTPAQLSGLEKEERTLLTIVGAHREIYQTQQQVASSTQQTVQSAHQYTEEIRKQAQAIRETKQWQEKGFVIIDGSNLSNQENIAKKKRVSLEEQILNLQQQGIYLSQDQTSKEWQLVDASGRRIASIQQENENLAVQRERVTEIAKEVRSLFAEGSFSRVSFTPTPLSGVRFIYQENDERAKGLTIEQQIERILKEQSAEYERQAKVKNISNSNAKNNINDIQAQTRAIEELLSKGKNIALLGNYKLFPEDMAGVSVAKQIALYEEQRKAGLIAANRELNLQVELTNAIAQAEGKITQEQEKRKKYQKPTITDDYQQILRNAVANKLGIDTSKVINADAQYDSIKRVGNALKQLQDAYSRMSNEERNSPIGKQMIRQMQELQRQSQQLRAQMSRPINLKDALGGSENTLDEIAYKMQKLASYRSGLNVETQKKEINTVNQEYDRLKKKMDEVMQKNSNMIASNNALGRSWNYMKNRLAFYFTIGASTQFIKNLIEVRSQYEMNERALGILINSAERGTQIFNELSQMALVSPYTLIELSNAAKQLTAYDIAAKDVVDTTRRLADMASAVGVPMERLTYALGQIKAYGYLNSRDARMFANAGIPLVRELSKYYSELEGKVVSVGDVYDRMKKKAIDYNSVMAVVTKMTDEGGKFFDFQAKMADTLKVRLANLTLAWNNMLNDIGASQQGVLTSGIGILRDLFLHWQDIYGAIQRVVLAIGLWKGAQALALLAVGELNTKMGMQVLLGEKLQTRLSSLAGSTKNLVSGYAVAGAALLFVIADAIMTYQRNAEEIEKLNKVIVDGAKESSNAIYEFIESAEMSYSRLAARTGKLPKPDAEKTWDALREQIELSAVSAKDIIPELIKIEDLNERVTKAFNLAERIAEANNKLIDLDGKLDISQDSILFGLFGEGLVEDIDDFNERLRISAQTEELYFKSTGSVITDVVQGLTGFFNDMKEKLGSSTEEAEREIKNFAHNAADAIKNELGEEGLKDSIQVNEAVSRVLKGIEQQFPQIKGKGKALFESIYNDIMANEFNGAVDKQAYYYKLFLERLKKDHGSAFQDVTEDIDRETFMWSDAQMKAIKKTADRIKEDIPEAYQDSVTEILNDLNTREFKMRIVAEFATTSIDDINKAFRKRFIESGVESVKEQVDEAQNGINKIKGLSPWGGNDEERKRVTQQETENLQKYGFLMKKANESDLDYQERISKERQKSLDISAAESKIIATNTGKEEEGAQVVLASAIEQKKAADERLKAISEVAEWGGYDFSTKKENTAATKAQHAAETELQKALKDELQLIDRVRSQYKKLTDAGANSGEALAYVTNQFGNSLARINSILGKNGIPLFDISKFAGTDNPQALLDMLKLQLDSAKVAKNIKPEEIKELEVKYSEIVVDAKAYNLSKITKGLNNELDRLKDEYELAVSLDADPELGNVFADMMGINIESLPHTVKEYADEYSKYLNKYLKGKNSALQFTGDELRSLTRDDITAFREQVDAGSFNQEWFDAILKAYEDISGKRKKDLEETEKWKNGLIEKYGNLQDKLTKIYKDSVQNQVNAVKTFGTEDQKSNIVRLQLRLEATDNPAELSEINTEIAKIVKDVIDKNPIALKLVTASNNQTKADTSKAYWEDFKNSELYAMTFEDMANNSTRAIQLIIDKLNELKDKVKEDPASMKALIKSLEDAENELNSRDPFAGIVNSIKNWSTASEEAKVAQEELRKAEQSVAEAQSELDDADDGTPEEQALAQKNLTDAIKKRGNAEAKVVQTENKAKKAQEQLKNSLQNLSNELGNVSGLLGSVSRIFRAVGDDDTADAIDAINEGFTIMTTVIMGVVAALVLLEASNPWLLAIAAALSVIVGLVSFLSGNSNKKITKQVEESERAVKRLENAYRELEFAAENAYGTAVAGANQAMKANKELQLVELKRQLALEQSRSSKNKDEDKIIDLTGQIIDLENEISKATSDTLNNLLGISSHGDFFEDMISDMISAFKNGEDAMKVFEEKWAEMIDNMIMKTIVSQVLQNWVDSLEDGAQKILDKFTAEPSKAVSELTNQMTDLYSQDAGDISEWIYDNDREAFKKILDSLGVTTPNFGNGLLGEGLRSAWFDEAWNSGLAQKIADAYKGMLGGRMDTLTKNLDKASLDATGDLIDYYSMAGEDFKENYLGVILERIKENWTFGQDSQKDLSQLQQGIQSISESTANALESYMNSVSQQVYYHSTLLEQIRDAIMGTNSDIQLGVQGQMLLQLQQSYQVQMSIQGILEGVLTPSGQGFRVELLS